MRALVIGAGIGGLAAALALARRGVETTVLERAPAFGEAGAGLQLPPNATRLLLELGLEAPLRQAAFAPLGVEVRDRAGGGTLLRTQLGEAAEQRWGAPYLQLHRADLHAILLAAATAAGARLYADSPVERFAQDAGRATVITRSQAFTADVVIGADGLRSRLRAGLQGEVPARYTGHVAWRALIEAEHLPTGTIAPTATVWTSRAAHVVHYFVRGGRLVNFVGFTPGRRAPPESWTETASPQDFAAAFRGWPEPVMALISAQGAEGRPGWRSAIYDRPPDRRWAEGRVALLGDAAHPMPPYVAQGAAMAIEDAVVLARHLCGSRDPPAALAAYAAERFARTRRVQAWAWRNGAVFHLPRSLRHAAFAVARAQGPSALDWLYGYDAAKAAA